MLMTDSAPKTHAEALTLALILAIQAPDDDKADECSRFADKLAAGMSPEEVEACKIAAKAACGLL